MDGKFRFCVYRKRNAVRVGDTNHIPRMDECIESCGDDKVISTPDANYGYWQIDIAVADREKMAFRSHHGL